MEKGGANRKWPTAFVSTGGDTNSVCNLGHVLLLWLTTSGGEIMGYWRGFWDFASD